MENPTLIRSATAGDLSQITRIYGYSVSHDTASFELDPPVESEMAMRWQNSVSGGFPYLVAERDGGVIGYAYAGPYRPRPAYRWSVEDTIYISSKAQGMGVGKLLLSRLVDDCTSLGFRQMIAVIGGSNRAASIGLHQAMGFQFSGKLQDIGWKQGEWLDVITMQKPLGRGGEIAPT